MWTTSSNEDVVLVKEGDTTMEEELWIPAASSE